MRFLTCKNLIKGFTLAEVLITLSIIGVIASMVIPSLVQDVQDAQLKTAWKKAYADFGQATKMLALANAGSLKGLCSTTNDHNCLRNLYLPYLNYTKVCDNGLNYGNCWHKLENYKYLNGPSSGSWNYAGLIINNGNLLGFVLNSPSCTYSTGSLNVCGWIYTDVNGFKGPNTLGKDVYTFYLLKDSIKAMGDGSACSDQGWNCSSYSLLH